MIPYWFMFVFPAVLAITYNRPEVASQKGLWFFVGVLYALLIGLRYQVGGDWVPYINTFDAINGLEFTDAITATDPGYAALNWLSGLIGADIYGVNLVCGGLFMGGLIAFSRQQPIPWLALCIGVPYLLIVVAMGYSRQGVALGLIFWALAALKDGRVRKFFVLVACAALFHKTAAVFFAFGLLSTARHGIFKVLAWAGFVFLISAALLFEYYESLWENYIGYDLSEGGAVRVWMNSVPAFIFFLYRKRWQQLWGDAGVWTWIAITALGCIPLVGIASTPTDRMALYLTPLQVAAYSRLPAFANSQELRFLLVLGVVAVYGAVLGVWLNFSYYANCCWIPYQTLLN